MTAARAIRAWRFAETAGSKRGRYLYLIAERALRAVGPLATSVLIVRQSGMSVHGEYVSVMALGALLGPLAGLGLTQPLLERFTRAPEQTAAAARAARRWRLASWAVAALGAAAFTLAFGVSPSVSRRAVYAALLAAYLWGITLDTPELRLQAAQHFLDLLIARALVTVSGLGLRLFVGFHAASAAWHVAITALELAVFQLLNQLQASRLEMAPPPEGAAATAPAQGDVLLRSGATFVAAGMLTAVYGRFDQFLMARLASAAAAGEYAAAMRLVDASALGVTIVLAPYATRLLTLTAPDQEMLRSFARTASRPLWLSFAAASLLAVLGPLLCALMYGRVSDEMSGALRIAAFHPLLVCVGSVAHTYLLRIQRTSLILAQTGVTAVSSATLNLLLIPRLGPRGAAISLVASQAVGLIAIALAFRYALRPEHERAVS